MSTSKNPLQGFRHVQPFIGFTSKIRLLNALQRNVGSRPRNHSHNSSSKKKKGSIAATQSLLIDSGAGCREELVWNVREFLQELFVSWKKKKNSWESIASVQGELEIDHPSLKQPETTYLWVNEHEDDYDYYGENNRPHTACSRSCCVGQSIEIMDALVGPVAVLLNPDRYEGDWWTTSPAEFVKGTERRWYGTDNFFLRHPALLSLMMGMFRQGLNLDAQGYGPAFLKTVNRKEIEECLTNSDPVLAMKLANKMRPWVEVPSSLGVNHFAFPKGGWHRLGQLHKAIYEHGFDALFEGDLHHSWHLAEDGKEKHGDRHSVVNGPIQYWGSPKGKSTAMGRVLTRLGK